MSMLRFAKTSLAVSLSALFSFSTLAFADEESSAAKWDINNPPFELNNVDIETDETTWSSLDVSPDGQTMVFDMLGNLFKVSTSGGAATSLTSDFAYDLHPAISPDGKTIAFISDRDGIANVWLMDIDGTNLRQVTKSKDNIIHSPKWSPDGEYIVVTKGIMSQRSIPAGEIWLYHKSGGEGVAVKKRVNGKHDQKNIADPAFSPDGRYIYYTQDITPGRVFDYNRDPLKGIFAVTRYDTQTGEEERYIGGSGGAIVPTPSPDGSQIAFVRRIRERTALFVKDVKSGNETLVYDGLEHDLQEGFGSEGYFAYFDWMPDSKNIMFWSGGHFHQINVESKTVSDVAVSVKTTLQYADALRFDVDVAPDEFDVKLLRWSQYSPDGKSALFQALGKLYVKDLKTGKVKRLTRQNDHDEYYPKYSPDGKSIIYTTWDDQTLGSVRVVPARGGKGKVISQTPGHYAEPAFSPDGKKVTYRKFTGGYLLSPEWSAEPGIYLADVDGADTKRVSNSGFNPHFSGNQSRVYFTQFVSGSLGTERELNSVDFNGEDKRTHLSGGSEVIEYNLSPNGKWVAFTYQYNVYVAPFINIGQSIALGPNTSSYPVKQVSSRAGEQISWTADSESIVWHHGPKIFQRDLTDAFAFLDGAPATLPEPVSEGVDLSFTVKSDKPTGVKALVGGRVVTMRNADSQQEIIEDGVVVIEDNRIVAVGKKSDVTIPDDAMIIDTSGKTILPGLVDTHAHGGMGSDQLIPDQNWTQYANLAFGVTTIHDPSNDTNEIFSAAELQKAGKRVMPRVFSTGTILYGAQAPAYKAIINTPEDAMFHVRRMKEVGAISVKSYNHPRRDQRQQVLAAAKELGMMVVPEGGGKFHQNMTMLMDGHTGLEHSIPIKRGYDDVTSLWSATDFGYTPTFVVAYGGLSGEYYWYDKTEVWKNPRLLNYTPQSQLDARSIRRPTAPEEQYNHFDIAKYAKELNRNGVSVHIGAHGQRAGLGAHWELWMMEQGGFTAWEALRGGTIDGANHLGMGKDIGSIEVGKLADLMVIDGNPLEDLRRSEFVEYTVLNGRIYSTSDMNEVGSQVKRQPFFFETLNNAVMPLQTQRKLEEKAHRYHWEH